MIKFIKPQTPYAHPHGEIYVGEHADCVRALKPKEWADHNFFRLGYLSPNGWTALKAISSFDKLDLRQWQNLTVYDCPYTNRTYQGMVPIGILTNDPLQYCHSPDAWYANMACDKEWNCPKGFLESSNLVELNAIQQCVIGPGYTHETMTNDGDSSLHPVVVDLTNGDAVLFITYVWHNK